MEAKLEATVTWTLDYIYRAGSKAEGKAGGKAGGQAGGQAGSKAGSSVTLEADT